MAVRSLAQSSLRQNPQLNSMLGGYQPNMFHHLETVRLGGNASLVEFTNLSRYLDYQHLHIRMVVRSDSSDAFKREVYLRFNGDSGANYSWHDIDGTASTVRSGAGANTTFIPVSRTTNSNSAAGQFNAANVDLLDFFDTSKYLTVRSFAGGATTTTSSSNDIYLYSGSWRSFSDISSMIFTLDSGNFVAGSRFSLYGIKARA